MRHILQRRLCLDDAVSQRRQCRYHIGILVGERRYRLHRLLGELVFQLKDDTPRCLGSDAWHLCQNINLFSRDGGQQPLGR